MLCRTMTRLGKAQARLENIRMQTDLIKWSTRPRPERKVLEGRNVRLGAP